MNLDLGMYILFPSTAPMLTINCPGDPLAMQSAAAHVSDRCPPIPIPPYE